MRILAIETSCDETAAAVVEDGVKIISNVVASSTEIHKKYGGVVPEIAAREQLRCIIPVINEALQPFLKNNQHFNFKTIQQNIDAVAVTVGPGLIGSLLIGVESAKTIAFVTGKPIIPVNHVLAHMYANFLQPSKENSPRVKSRDNLIKIQFPAISLVVSGGHTELYLMESMKKLKWLGGTLDDAAGEAFDKTARLMGFENRGGVAIQEAAKKCQMSNDKCQIKLPRPKIHDDDLNFSFSGLKTATLREWKKYEVHSEQLISTFAHEVQESIIDVLVAKTVKAARQYIAHSILVSGGVAANLRLRSRLSLEMNKVDLTASLHIPAISLCTDNAVYIAAYAYFRGIQVDWHDIEAVPDLSVEV